MNRPGRLHHHAFVVADQERTRQFYEDVVGLPLIDTWCEHDGNTAFCHTFYELGDGSALAFFQFADPQVQAANTTPSSSVFDHVAQHATPEVQAAIDARAAEHGYPTLTIDHGYCTSLYLSDPDGLVLEVTVDKPEAVAAAPDRRTKAHDELARWMAGDHTENNTYRRSI